jgi:hypothetical protein
MCENDRLQTRETMLLGMVRERPDDRRLTGPQHKAIAWLPADGSWTVQSPGRLSAAINSLTLFHKDLAEEQWGDFGPRGGRCRRLRLTPKGVELRKERGL